LIKKLKDNDEKFHMISNDNLFLGPYFIYYCSA